MALIKCPECGKEISDQSNQCIHCGYPLINIKQNNSQINYICKINGKDYDLKQVIDVMEKDKSKTYETLKNITGLDKRQCAQLLLIINDINNIPKKFNNGDTLNLYKNSNSIVSCPKCGCTEFVPLRRKFSLLTGFATNKVDMVCSKCGTKIK